MEIKNGIIDPEKRIFEVAKDLADYYIEKLQTKENSEYVGKVPKIDRLEYAGSLTKILKSENNKEKLIDELLVDFKQMLNKQTPFTALKFAKLILEVQNLDPLIEINLTEETVNKTFYDYKTEFGYYIGKKEEILRQNNNNCLLSFDSLEDFSKYVEVLVKEFLSSNIEDYQEFLNEELVNRNIYCRFLREDKTKSKNIITVDSIKLYIDLKEDREQWDYPIEDMVDAINNNEYLVISKENNRIYEVTEKEFIEIIEQKNLEQKIHQATIEEEEDESL